MLRLTMVFLVWVASTGYALEDEEADYDAQLHEAYVEAWNEADREQRRLLARAQRGWREYRAANCELLGEGCYALMTRARVVELRRALTETNVRTIMPGDGLAGRSEDER